ncbi:putative ABC transporter permease subunit [Clostridium felsineum]|uniref:Uncharacterized protein n=1 Tax=Clostridium felsineum TaxID=36839 RepID=A0A1S8LLB1_9CLOT|nr:hypothetical protein [Clostridium felsineum]URZ08008.1 hypothetical protein CLROS_033740 [Clostridium felsineum]URZ13039.1 hypothetical protein CROST_037890 [Clostridium felsineum]
MCKIFKLTRNLFKVDNTLFMGWTKEKNKLFIMLGGITCILIESVLVKIMLTAYEFLSKSNLQNLLIAASFSVATLLTILFSFFYILGMFYFSKDLKILMTLPLKAYEIIGAKTLLVLIYEYFLELFFILPLLVTFNYKFHDPIFGIYSIIVYIVFPIIPISFCSVISILIMWFAKFINNKRLFKLICGVFICFFVLGIYILNVNANSNDLYLMKNMTDKNYKILTNNIISIFPGARFITYSFVDYANINGFINLLILIIFSGALFFVMMLCTKLLYFKSIAYINEDKTIKKKTIKRKSYKKRLVIISYTVKELKNILRTPAYFQNCIISGVIVPCVIFIVLCKVFLKNYMIADNIFFVFGTSIIIFISQLNEICCTSISREGNLFFIVKYIPINFKIQILGKAISGIIISFLSEILILVSSVFIFKIKVYISILVAIVSTLGIIGFSFLGLLIDLKLPKFEWENEVAVINHNFNTSIHTVLTLIISIFISIITFMFQMNLKSNFFLMILIYILLDVCMYKLLLSNGSEIIDNDFYFNKTYVNNVGKVAKKIKAIFVFAVIIISIVFIFTSISTKVHVTISKANFEIKAGFIDKSYSIKKVTNIYLKDTLPETHKIFGDDVFGVKRGEFYVEGLGKGMLFLQKSKGPFIYVIVNRSFVIINSKNVDDTKKIYRQLLKKVKLNKQI